MAPSRTMRQATVGLGILAILGLGAWLGQQLWTRRATGGSYRATIEFQSASGMQPGTSVAYRGVRIGQVTSISPKPSGVDIEVAIAPASLLIPINSRVEANQSGLIGETAIDIVPLQDLDDPSLASPLDANCDPDIIICNGSRLRGEDQLDINVLIRSLLDIADTLGSAEFASNLNEVSRNASIAFAEIGELSEEFLTVLEERPLDEPLGAIEDVATALSGLVNEVEQPLVGSLESLDSATTRIADVIDTEGETVKATLVSIQQTSDRLQGAIAELTPVLVQVNQSEIVDNFEALSRDAATAVTSLRDLTGELNDPETIVQLQTTIDSARAALDNVLKITADVNELTGNEAFRNNVRQLIESLENLLSSTQKLEQQVARAQLDRALEPTAEAPPAP
ncbi:MAG: MlaD family protein [Cyanobacteria bacterium J06641_5]